MPRRRAGVGQVDGRLAPALDKQGLLPVGVAAGNFCRDSRRDLHVAVDQLELPRVLQRGDVLHRIGGPQLGIAGHRNFPFEPLHDVLGPRKGRDQLAVGQANSAPRMVKMQMREDDHVDVLGREPFRRQAVDDWITRIGPQQQPLFVAEFGAVARVDQHVLPARLDENAVRRLRDAVVLVDRDHLRPHHLGHDAKHRPPVRTKPPAGNRANGEIAKLHG